MTNFDELLISWFGSVHESVVTSFIICIRHFRIDLDASYLSTFASSRKTCSTVSMLVLNPLCRAPMRIRKCEVLEFVCGDADPSFKPDVLAHTQARIGEPPIRRAERRRLRRALISRLTATVNMLLDCPCHARSSSPAHSVESANRTE
jgi:hypothetical protein